jgi:hypothetical protein
MKKKSQRLQGGQRFDLWIMVNHFSWFPMTRSSLVPVFGDGALRRASPLVTISAPEHRSRMKKHTAFFPSEEDEKVISKQFDKEDGI